MDNTDDFLFHQKSEQLYIHFDVPTHYLKLDTFINSALQTKLIIEGFNNNFFQGNLDYELIVLPPEEGSFLSKLAVYVWGGLMSLGAFIESDIGKGYIEGLTGKLPQHWAKQIGESHSDVAKENGLEFIPLKLAPSDKNIDCKLGSKIIVEMTRGVLESDQLSLNKLGMNSGHFQEIMVARSEFYQTCISDSEVKGIGFTSEDYFPIPRNQFPERASKIVRKDDEEESTPWFVSIENITVNSPNWDKQNQHLRQWKGKDSTSRDCWFIIDDQDFWFHVLKKDLNVVVLDKLKVQWAYKNENGRIKNRRVIRVLEYNNDKLGDELNENAIKAILGNYDTPKKDENQDSLF